MKKKILLTGGAGFIGSHLFYILNEYGYEIFIIDDLSEGNKDLLPDIKIYEINLTDFAKLDNFFSKHNFDLVIHCAAKAIVSESMKMPNFYYNNNFIGTYYLLEMMRKYRIRKIIFSSSCAVYGQPNLKLINEIEKLSPKNPYGNTKLSAELLIKDYAISYDIKYIILRFFNAAGADDKLRTGERRKCETHLIPLALKSILEEKEFYVYGYDHNTKDGTTVRDYVHVSDIADAHLKSIKYLYSENQSNVFNVGIGKGFSILEVLNSIKEVTGKKVNYTFMKKRDGDPDYLVSDTKKIRSNLNWKPNFMSINSIIESSWLWYLKEFKKG